MNFSVTILGSGSAVPTSRRGLTSQYVCCDNRHILIDCGEGTQMRLRDMGIKFQRIDHVLISHLHGDHYFGLVGLLSTMHLLGRERPLAIYAAPELKGIIESQIHYHNRGLGYDLNFIELTENGKGILFEDEVVKIEYFPLDHKVPTSGFTIVQKEKERRLNKELAEQDKIKIEYYHRLKQSNDVIDDEGNVISFQKYTTEGEQEKRYAFCSDTRYNEEVVGCIEGCDLLYHEATFTEEHKERAQSTFHSTGAQAGKIAKLAGVKKLILGHISARYDSGNLQLKEAIQEFENTVIAEDGSTFHL